MNIGLQAIADNPDLQEARESFPRFSMRLTLMHDPAENSTIQAVDGQRRVNAGSEGQTALSAPGFKHTLGSTLPTLLTGIRFLLAAAFPFASHEWRIAAVLAAAASDGLDGYLSRLFKLGSTRGRWLDPIADKAFVGSALATLVVEATITLTELILVALRDITVAVLAMRALITPDSRRSPMKPSLLGKMATAAQFAFVVSLLFSQETVDFLFLPTAALSGAAAVDYCRRYSL